MSNILDILTICRKSGNLELGFDPMKEALSAGKAYAVIAAADISPKTEKEARFFAEKYSVPYARSDITLDSAQQRLGKRAGIFTVCESGLARKAAELLGAGSERASAPLRDKASPH